MKKIRIAPVKNVSEPFGSAYSLSLHVCVCVCISLPSVCQLKHSFLQFSFLSICVVGALKFRGAEFSSD